MWCVCLCLPAQTDGFRRLSAERPQLMAVLMTDVATVLSPGGGGGKKRKRQSASAWAAEDAAAALR
jgi:hypothetical protein